MRVLKFIGVGLAGLVGAIVLVAVVVVVVAGWMHEARAPERTIGGARRTTSVYVTMGDGARIAVDIALPARLVAGARAPVLIKGTPYWRGADLNFLGRALAQLGLVPEQGEPDAGLLNERGYVVVTVDTRGTGASFGRQEIMFSDREVKDFGEIIDWAVRQPWSNGKVGAYGFSYRGMLAVNMASLGRPALKAIAPSFDFTDVYLIAHPGGVFSQTFVKSWSEQTGLLNAGKLPCEGLCKLVVAGPERVDADRDGSLRAAAIADHKTNYDVFACARAAPDRDSRICASGRSLSEVSEFARKAGVEASGLPMMVIVGWFDSVSPGQALERFASWSNPQTLIVGAISHGGFMSTDPFARGRPDPTYRAQISATADFFDAYLKDDARPAPAKSLRYLVLNGGGWRTSATWPPAGSQVRPLYLAPGHGLSEAAPAAGPADGYDVDFTADSGPLSRHQSPVSLSHTDYADRARQDARLLVYNGAPMTADLTLAGEPRASLSLASSAPDGAVIVYLELVEPNGRVVYLSEGELRLAHRKAGTVPGSGDPLHSHLAADDAPMIPGKAETVEIALAPIAVKLHKGERLRVAIAGADAGNFERLPAAGAETFAINLGGASRIDLPVTGEGEKE